MLILLYTLYSDVVGIGISVTVLYTIQYQCYYKVYCWTLLVSHSYNKSDEFLVNAIEHARVSQSLSFLHQSDSMQVHPECMHFHSLDPWLDTRRLRLVIIHRLLHPVIIEFSQI